MHRLMRILAVLFGSLGVLIGLVSVGSGAVSKLAVQQLPPVSHRVSGGTSTILVRVRTSPAATCRATVSVKRVRQTLPSVTADARGRVGWRWLILPTSPSGRWRIATVCHSGRRSGKASRKVSVATRSRKAIGSVGDPTSLTTTAGSGAGTCGPFRSGQACLAYRNRKDVYDTAVAHGVPGGGSRAPGRDFSVWDAGQWFVNALRAGLPTGDHPAAGALVVWGVPDSASYGRIAYVVQATSDTRVLVTECSFDWTGRCRTLWTNPQAIANLQGYIHTQPAGGGTPISIQGAAAPVNTAAPTMVGTPAVRSTLTATNGGWTGSGAITYAFQWQSSPNGSSGWTGAPGSGATTSSYMVAVADAGRYLRVVVTASTAGGSAGVASAARAVIPYNTAPPTTSGSLIVGRVLTATPGTWIPGATSFAYQWQVSADNGTTWANATGTGNAGIKYTIAGADQGRRLRVLVTATSPAGQAAGASAITGVVVAPPTGTVALWHMDETSPGNTTADSSGRGHTGTLNGGVVTGLPGSTRAPNPGTAFGFNGLSSYVSVPSAGDLSPGSSKITITIHLQTTVPPPLTPDWDLIRKGYFTSAGGQYKVEYQPGGFASCGFNDSSGNAAETPTPSGPALNDGLWHKVQCVKDASKIQLFVDDALAYSLDVILGSIDNTDPVVIGARPASEFFNGSLDEASITFG